MVNTNWTLGAAGVFAGSSRREECGTVAWNLRVVLVLAAARVLISSRIRDMDICRDSTTDVNPQRPLSGSILDSIQPNANASRKYNNPCFLESRGASERFLVGWVIVFRRPWNSSLSQNRTHTPTQASSQTPVSEFRRPSRGLYCQRKQGSRGCCCCCCCCYRLPTTDYHTDRSWSLLAQASTRCVPITLVVLGRRLVRD